MIREVLALKRLWRFSLILLVIYILPIVALAHPGRTDSKGGHTNKSTGEYHYHHGYSAHDHYDMDGDGNIDCPYDFKDNTASKPYAKQQTSSSKPKQAPSAAPQTIQKEEQTVQAVKPTQNKLDAEYLDVILTCVFVIVIFISGFFTKK